MFICLVKMRKIVVYGRKLSTQHSGFEVSVLVVV